MAKRKRKTLPKDFEDLLEQGDFDELWAVFDACDVNARGGFAKQTALAFDNCPDDLARWLVAEGADLSATDTWGNTPLHNRARSWRTQIDVLLELGADVHDSNSSIGTPLHAAADSYNVPHARLLLEHGAKVNERNSDSLTPLELALYRCNNINIEDMAELAAVLLKAGAKKTSKMKKYVEEIGKQFEFHQSGFNPNLVDATVKALGKLYKLFDVTPVASRKTHDGKSPIVVESKTWQKRHEELWELLVPSKGAAETVQGEVVRIAGRITRELDGNGGGNWDAEYVKMADAFLDYVQQGEALSTRDYNTAEALVADAKKKVGSPAQLARLAVKWVLQNPQPMKLAPPKYRR